MGDFKQWRNSHHRARLTSAAGSATARYIENTSTVAKRVLDNCLPVAGAVQSDDDRHRI